MSTSQLVNSSVLYAAGVFCDEELGDETSTIVADQVHCFDVQRI